MRTDILRYGWPRVRLSFHMKITIIEEGKKAFRKGISMAQNPYDKYSDEWYWWNLGWKDEWWDEGEKTWRPQ